jgi:hypothetical protein
MKGITWRASAVSKLLAGAGLGLLIAIAGLLVISAAGCGSPQIKTPPPPPQKRTQPVEAGPSGRDFTDAKQAVTNYLNALYDQNYTGAYALLSADSQSKHPEKEFKRNAAAASVSYDTAKAKAQSEGADRIKVIVEMQAEEEPGAKAFVLTKESGQWRIVYTSGTPFSPYAD